MPNNLGPTLMIVAALLLLPLGIGLPLLLLALARLRTIDGSPAFPRLRLAIRRLVRPGPTMQTCAALPTASDCHR